MELVTPVEESLPGGGNNDADFEAIQGLLVNDGGANIVWLKSRRGISMPERAQDIIQMIEMACLHMYFLREFVQSVSL